MTRAAAAMLMVLVLSGAAYAQPASKGYVEGVAQSAFGNVTSQSFGAEVGVTVAPQIQVFVDVGRVRDTAPASLGADAQTIAGFLSQTQSGVSFSVRQPATFGVAGIRYAVPTGIVEPYVLIGGGAAQVKRNVSFSVGGTDVTSSLQQYGVTLGTDLSGSETKGMLEAGVGVAWPFQEHFVVDLQYRYGRIFTSDQGLNVNRAGIGVGYRF